MGKSSPVSVRLDPTLNEQVSLIAESLDRPRSWVIEQAIKDFVALQQWQVAAIEEGIADAKAGRVVSHEAVVEWVRSWNGPNELPPPKCD